MDYEKIKDKLLEIQGMMQGIPDECKGMSKDASENRVKYTTVKSSVERLIKML